MIRPFVVMGDKTSHGGTVISADFTSDIHGKYMARVGDMVVCPKCKGVFAINSGAPDMVDGAGRGYARHMDTTVTISRPHIKTGQACGKVSHFAADSPLLNRWLPPGAWQGSGETMPWVTNHALTRSANSLASANEASRSTNQVMLSLIANAHRSV